VLVLVGHLPLILERYPGLVLYKDLLFTRNSFVNWREKEFLVVAQFQRGFVAVPNQTYPLDVGWVVVVDALGYEVVVSGCLRVEFEAHESERLPLNQPHRREGIEGLA
jgi:hypothetical protein